MSEVTEFDPNLLESDTHVILYDVLTNDQRKAVVRECFHNVVEVNGSKLKVFRGTHSDELLDNWCKSLIADYGMFLEHAHMKHECASRFMDAFNEAMAGCAKDGWRWHRGQLQFKRRSNENGQQRRAEDRKAEAVRVVRQADRKRFLEELDERVQSSKKQSKKRRD